MEFNALLTQVATEARWEYHEVGEGEVVLLVNLSSWRTQKVSVGRFVVRDKVLARYLSVVGPSSGLSEDRLRAALRVNAGLPFGALAIRGEDLVFCETQLIDQADPEEVHSSIDFIARKADEYERLLFNKDES